MPTLPFWKKPYGEASIGMDPNRIGKWRISGSRRSGYSERRCVDAPARKTGGGIGRNPFADRLLGGCWFWSGPYRPRVKDPQSERRFV
jgi:hypothetical protein